MIFLPEIIMAGLLHSKAQIERDRRYAEALAKLPQDQQDRINAERRHRETVDAINRLSDTVREKSFSIF